MTVWIVVNSRDEFVGGHPDKNVARGIMARARDSASPHVWFGMRAVEVGGIQLEDKNGRDKKEAKATA